MVLAGPTLSQAWEASMYPCAPEEMQRGLMAAPLLFLRRSSGDTRRRWGIVADGDCSTR